MAESYEESTMPIDDNTIVDRAVGPKLGTSWINMPQGRALCTDAVTTSVCTIRHDVEGRFVVIVATAAHDGRLLGSLTPLSPDNARGFAASIIRAAHEIDGWENG